MPEEAEIETDKLSEAIHEEMEKQGSGFLKQIALTTAVLAAFAAVAALQAGSTVNEALVLKTESTRLQAQASDQWTYYQAKGLKAAVQEATRSTVGSGGQAHPRAAAGANRPLRRRAGRDQEGRRGEGAGAGREIGRGRPPPAPPPPIRQHRRAVPGLHRLGRHRRAGAEPGVVAGQHAGGAVGDRPLRACFRRLRRPAGPPHPWRCWVIRIHTGPWAAWPPSILSMAWRTCMRTSNSGSSWARARAAS